MEINVNINIKNLEGIITLLKNTTKSNALSINKENKAQNHTTDDIKEILAQISQSGKTTQVKEILTKHGATKISNIPTEQVNNIYTELTKIN